MEEASTRHPTGYGENAGIIGIFTSIGLYLGGLVDDPNLSNAIVVGTAIGGKAILTGVNNYMGGTLANLVGMNAMKGAKLGMILLAAYLPLGCGSGLMGIGDEWTKEDCKVLDWVNFSANFICTSDDPEVCRESAMAAYHTGRAICLGLSDDAETEVAASE